MGNEEYYRSDMHGRLVASPYASVISLAGLGLCAWFAVVPLWTVEWGVCWGLLLFVCHVLKWLKRREAFEVLPLIWLFLSIMIIGKLHAPTLETLALMSSCIATYSNLLFFNRRRIREAFAKGASRETPA